MNMDFSSSFYVKECIVYVHNSVELTTVNVIYTSKPEGRCIICVDHCRLTLEVYI